MNERLSAKHVQWLWGSLVAVLIVAVFFRFWQIDSIPPGLFGDEATDGVDALDVLAGRGQVFFPANYGREGLHMWIVALSIKLLGVSPFAVRLPSIIAGIVTALATFWLGYEMFVHRPDRSGQAPQPGNRLWIYLIPLLASLYVSTSFWHVHFSRFGIRGIFTTTTTTLTMAALWRALNTHRWRWFAVSGTFLGLGMHFYTASRFVPIVLAVFYTVWLLLSLLGVRQQDRLGSVLHLVTGTVIQFTIAALIFVPLGYYFLTHPGSFTQRASEVSAFQGGLSLEVLAIIARAASANLLQFVWPGAGDRAQFYNLPGRAVFDPLTAVLALAGIVISARRWRNPVYGFLLAWFLVMALPAFIAVDRYPTLPRLLGVIPGVYFFPAIGLSALVRFIIKWLDKAQSSDYIRRLGEIAAVGFFVIALFVHAGLTFRDYFRIWGLAPATATAFEADMAAAWRWLEAHPGADNGKVYLSSDIYRHPTFMFLHEQTPTSEWFTHRNLNLHWFDGRAAWPLSAPDQPATVLVGDSALPPDFIVALLDLQIEPVDDGTVMLAQSAFQIDALPLVQYTDQLSLLGQFALVPTDLGQIVLVQVWQTKGPEGEDWRRYQIQSALQDDTGKQIAQAADAMRLISTEWTHDGIFITWQTLPWADLQGVTGTALRVVPEGESPLQPVGANEGWLALPLVVQRHGQ